MGVNRKIKQNSKLKRKKRNKNKIFIDVLNGLCVVFSIIRY